MDQLIAFSIFLTGAASFLFIAAFTIALIDPDRQLDRIGRWMDARKAAATPDTATKLSDWDQLELAKTVMARVGNTNTEGGRRG